jgi:cytochrome c oxidase subunit 3
MNTSTLLRSDAPDTRGIRSVDLAVWLVIGVSTCLFVLLLTVDVLSRQGGPAAPGALPHQLWFGTACLIAAGQLLRMAKHAARLGQWPRCRALWLAGGASTALFVGCQLWAWQGLQDGQMLTKSSTATGLFYLLTGMHGLHVLGGLIAWAAAAPVGDPSATEASAWRLALCVRYWHFLLVVWLALYAVLAGLTG